MANAIKYQNAKRRLAPSLHLGETGGYDTMLMMDHAEATQKFAVEQYVLGEMSEAEQAEFEQHFFACAACAEAIEEGATLTANARSVFAETNLGLREQTRQHRAWSFWASWRWAPAGALAGWAVAALLAGYQFLRAPGNAGEFAIAPAVSIRATRAAQGLTFSKHNGAVAFAIDHEWEQSYTVYEAQIERAADHQMVFVSTIPEARVAANPLSVSLRPARLQTGAYTLTLYGLAEGAARTPLERISFTLTE
jgi:hypothetical protein